jgi:hypothetical protein
MDSFIESIDSFIPMLKNYSVNSKLSFLREVEFNEFIAGIKGFMPTLLLMMGVGGRDGRSSIKTTDDKSKER